MNARGRLVAVLSGLIAAAVVSLLVVYTSCTPADRQTALVLAPAAGEVLCQQVVSDQQGQQICRVTTDVLADLLPLVLAAREARDRANAGRCGAGGAAAVAAGGAGGQSPPGAVPGVQQR